MPFYPGSNTSVRGTSPGSYRGGPFRLIIHTTEGGSAEGAFSAYRSKGVWPHATIDERTIYQHIDTATSASAVLNESGGVETNRLSAIQIEMVGFAAKPKNREMLALAAAFCAWAGDVHGIPPEWPNGRPMGSGGPHNRSVENWKTRGGWYGHSQVPENTHWDPGALTDDELAILMGEQMEPARTFINGSDVATTVRSWLAEGNSVIDASEWAAFCGYPPPEWDNAWQDAEYAGALKVSTKKVTCEVVDCPNPSVELVALKVKGGAVRAWVCAAHGGKP